MAAVRQLLLVDSRVAYLEFNAKKECNVYPGAYADYEVTDPNDKRKILRRERFRITGPTRKIGEGVIECRARAIEAPDYAATQNMRAARAVIVVALIHIVVMATMDGCPRVGRHEHRRRRRGR